MTSFSSFCDSCAGSCNVRGGPDLPHVAVTGVRTASALGIEETVGVLTESKLLRHVAVLGARCSSMFGIGLLEMRWNEGLMVLISVAGGGVEGWLACVGVLTSWMIFDGGVVKIDCDDGILL